MSNRRACSIGCSSNSRCAPPTCNVRTGLRTVDSICLRFPDRTVGLRCRPQPTACDPDTPMDITRADGSVPVPCCFCEVSTTNRQVDHRLFVQSAVEQRTGTLFIKQRGGA